jgi:D-alanyl-D-alanine carboxypeptidase
MAITFVFCFASVKSFAISARSAVVIDASSGRLLYVHNKDEIRGMASTTKIMTAICAIEYGEPEKIVTISKTASGVEGSSMYLAVGEKIKLIDLIYGLMLVSGNDAATAIAETVAGDTEKFAELMNKKAYEIGAYNTHFTNPHGLSDKNHYTTAHDLAKITAYAMKNTIFCEIAATKKKTLPANEGGYARTLVNHNKFLSMYDGCIGVKTGFTKATGRCLVTAAEKNNLRLICVTLNASDDWNDHKELLNYSFKNYQAYNHLKADTKVGTAKIKNSITESVEIYLKNDVVIPIKPEEEELLGSKVEVFEDLSAPIKKGDVLGRYIITLNDESFGFYPLISKTDADEKKMVFKTQYNISQTFKKMIYLWLICFQ